MSSIINTYFIIPNIHTSMELMKQFKLAALSFLALSLISTAAYTAETIHSEAALSETKHTVGLIAGVASGEYKGSSRDGDGIAQAYLFYNYQAFSNISFEVAYTRANEINNWDWECDRVSDDRVSCTYNDGEAPLFNIAAEELDLDSFVIAIKGDAALSQRNSLYGKVGAQYYDYDLHGGTFFSESDTGTGLFVEAGWQYRWDLGIGMNVGLRYQDMGDLTLKSSNVGISYTF